LIFDIETDGFLETMTRVHSLVIKCFETGEVWSIRQDKVADGLRMLMEADIIVGHNIIKFDLPALQKLYPWFTYDRKKVLDTIIMSRLIWTQIVDTDMAKIRAGTTTLTPALAGWHSLEAWGHRLGNWKGDYSKMMEERGLDPWAEWSQEMQDYCEQDVSVNEDLFKLILGKEYDPRAIELEHSLAFIMAEMERTGFAFDIPAAERLYVDLAGKREELSQELRDLFPPWFVRDGTALTSVRTPKKAHKTLGYWGEEGEPYMEEYVKAYDPDDGSPIMRFRKVKPFKGYPYTKIKLNIFNPNSRDQIADRLMRVRGWKPREMTPGGKPKVDEDVLGELKYPEAKRLTEYMLLQKRIGQLSEGDNAWLKMVKPNGRIHGSINQNGAVTGRATHSRPNIAQVPKVGTLYGAECRALFYAAMPGRVQLGCDVSGLELRMLGHFMAKHDGGAYGREVIEGDIHTLNQNAAGLPTRDSAKTFIYAFLYGAGDGKIGSIIGKGRQAGKALKAKFFKQVPALKKLIEGVQRTAAAKGHLKGLDGRLLHVRSEHSALNTLLQSAGAIVCKAWIIEFDRLLRERGLHNVVSIVAWVHDELQMEVVAEYADEVGKVCVEAIENAGIFLGIRVPLTGEYKIGKNWKECH
jgi:DNA polymerase I-like protein with 3'-5' exonuclease and polymerase domains